MKRFLLTVLGLIVIALVALYFTIGVPGLVKLGGRVLNTVRSANNPPGTLTVETREAVAATAPASPAAATENAGDWPSYNRNVQSQRFSALDQITAQNVGQLKQLCVYDTGVHDAFETGPLEVDGALIGTTAFDIFSIDPSTCKQNWRTHDDEKTQAFLQVNRGAAYLDGRLFRGTLDGRVLAYDFKTGKLLWATAISDASKNESVNAAPIAANGVVYAGVVIGDFKNVRGRVDALAADTGKILWETYLVPKQAGDPERGPQGSMPADAAATWNNPPNVPISGGGSWTSFTLDPDTNTLYVPVGNPSPDFVPGLRRGKNLFTDSVVALDAKTGNYIRHYQISDSDWHDWDVSNTPELVTTRDGKHILSFAPKDGYLYAVDATTNALVYRSPVTRIENPDVPFSTDKVTHFCPGSVGGGEWNGVAYDPRTNLVLTGEDEWCSSVKLQSDKQVEDAADGSNWMGNVSINPLNALGTQDPHADWAGWLYATDADSGQWKWRAKTNYPILSGVTPTAGGVVFFGDMGGNFYALDAGSGKKLWSAKIAGAIGGGVITYTANGSQKVAVAAGLINPLWPTEQDSAKIVVFGLDK